MRVAHGAMSEYKNVVRGGKLNLKGALAQRAARPIHRVPRSEKEEAQGGAADLRGAGRGDRRVLDHPRGPRAMPTS